MVLTAHEAVILPHTEDPDRFGIPSISKAVWFSWKVVPKTNVWFQRSPSLLKMAVEIIGKFFD